MEVQFFPTVMFPVEEKYFLVQAFRMRLENFFKQFPAQKARLDVHEFQRDMVPSAAPQCFYVFNGRVDPEAFRELFSLLAEHPGKYDTVYPFRTFQVFEYFLYATGSVLGGNVFEFYAHPAGGFSLLFEQTERVAKRFEGSFVAALPRMLLRGAVAGKRDAIEAGNGGFEFFPVCPAFAVTVGDDAAVAPFPDVIQERGEILIQRGFSTAEDDDIVFVWSVTVEDRTDVVKGEPS